VIKRSQLVRLRDVLGEIDAVSEMISDVDFGAYRQDHKLRRAIERCIEIVSEASRHVPRELKAQYSDQPWHEIAAIGNLLRHHYQRVDDFIIWKIATRSLPRIEADHCGNDREGCPMTC
jgi:uncharacterized protein with HEPN domain